MAEGKNHAMAVGLLTLSTTEMFDLCNSSSLSDHLQSHTHLSSLLIFSAKVNKGIGIEILHVIGDGFWNADYRSLNVK